MLQAIRGGIGSWIVKILFAFLILSFAVWGIGDMFRDAPPSQVVATVGEREIGIREIEDLYRDRISQLQRLAGGRLDIVDQVRRNVLDDVLAGRIEAALLDAAAVSLGLSASDAAVRAVIREDPSFSDPMTGVFSEAQFRQALAFSRLTEPDYVAAIRRDLGRSLVVQTVQTVPGVPEVLVDAVFEAERERRIADVVSIDGSAIAELPEPGDDELRRFHQENPDQFEAPEYRQLSVLMLLAEDLAEEIAVDEEDLRQQYEAQIESFVEPERRRFDQALFPLDAEEAALAFAERLRQGANFDGALAEAGVDDVASQPIEWTTIDEMFPVALADAAFDLEAGAVSDPIASAFRLHVLRVAEVREAGPRPFEEALEDLSRDERFNRAADTLFELSNAVDDALGGGGSLEEAAQAVGVSLLSVPPISRGGTVQDPAAMVELPALEEVIRTAFPLSPGGVSRRMETPDGNGTFVVRVDAVIPPEVRPFETVRDAVAAAWEADARAEAARRSAEQAVGRLDRGETVDAIAADLDAATATRTDPLLPSGQGADWPQVMVDALFTLTRGQTTAVFTGDRAHALLLVDIVPADAATDADARIAIADRLAADMAGDFRAAFLAAEERRIGVERDQSAIDSFLGEQ